MSLQRVSILSQLQQVFVGDSRVASHMPGRVQDGCGMTLKSEWRQQTKAKGRRNHQRRPSVANYAIRDRQRQCNSCIHDHQKCLAAQRSEQTGTFCWKKLKTRQCNGNVVHTAAATHLGQNETVIVGSTRNWHYRPKNTKQKSIV